MLSSRIAILLKRYGDQDLQAYKNKFDIYELYEASVQNVITDLNFDIRVFKHNTKTPTTIRENFCGTAKLAINWVLKDKKNKSVAIDLNESVLNWTKNIRFQN